jgi:hypothetical protein
MNSNFGSGPALNEDFDFIIDNTGELESSSSVEELGKDLSMQMVLNLEKYLGQSPTNLLRRKVELTATRVATADTRVREVDTESTTVSFSNRRDELTVEMRVLTESGPQEFVFNV